jgi:hypothetical protein
MGKLTFEEVAYEKGYRQALKDGAAPELLAACERCEQYLIVAAMDHKDNEALLAHATRDLEMLRAAIAKAEGDK